MSEIKPVLRQMIDNNKPHWRPETIRGAHRQMDEYEAKAKAFDAIMREWEDERMAKSHILETIQKYYDEYESGESE